MWLLVLGPLACNVGGISLAKLLPQKRRLDTSPCFINVQTQPARFPSGRFGRASYSWRKHSLLTPAALSKATGGSSGGVNISGSATPAPLTSRFVSTPLTGCLPSHSASARVHAS